MDVRGGWRSGPVLSSRIWVSRSQGGEEEVGDGDPDGVAVPAEPGGLVIMIVMVQSEPGFRLPVVVLDAPSDRTS